MASARVKSTDFYISSHGSAAPNETFTLPSNVRVVMLCSDESMTACEENELRLFRTISNDFGSNLEKLIKIYNTSAPSHVAAGEHELCVFSPNFNMKHISDLMGSRPIIDKSNVMAVQSNLFPNMDKCPDLLLSDEKKTFRTGVYNVPAKFNRVYVSDYVSSTTGDLKSAGMIEPLDLTGLESRNIEAKILGSKPLNRLEKLIVMPFPTYKPTISMKDHVRFQREGEIMTAVNSPYLSSVMSIASIVVPDTDTYTSLLSYKNDRGEILLSEVVKKISTEYPDRLCTVMISACRPALRETVVGIPLNQYITDTSIGDSVNRSTKETVSRNKSRFTYDANPVARGYIYDTSYRSWDNYMFSYKSIHNITSTTAVRPPLAARPLSGATGGPPPYSSTIARPQSSYYGTPSNGRPRQDHSYFPRDDESATIYDKKYLKYKNKYTLLKESIFKNIK